MRKYSTIKRVSVATALALSLITSLTVGSGKALATASYLSAPTGLSLTNYAGASSFLVNNTTTIYYTPTSAYGNTIPSASQVSSFLGIPVSNVVSLTDSTTPFYSISGANGTLNLSLLNQISSSFTTTLAGTTPVASGTYISNVFMIDSGSTMAGAVAGDLVFTYQFYQQTVSATNGGISGATIGPFNDPNNFVYTLGTGSTDTSSIGGTTISCSSCTELGSSTATNGTLDSTDTLAGVQGNVNYSTGGSILTLGLSNNTGGIAAGIYTPEILVASTATGYSLGGLSFLGLGAGSVPVFVPNVPEPGTLVLFGTALGFVAFLVVKRRRNQMVA